MKLWLLEGTTLVLVLVLSGSSVGRMRTSSELDEKPVALLSLRILFFNCEKAGSAVVESAGRVVGRFFRFDLSLLAIASVKRW
jgi:hypothetical protein